MSTVNAYDYYVAQFLNRKPILGDGSTKNLGIVVKPSGQYGDRAPAGRGLLALLGLFFKRRRKRT